MKKRVFLVIGATSTCKHLITALLIKAGCRGDASGNPINEQLEWDRVCMQGKEPPVDLELAVHWRSQSYNGVYHDLGNIKRIWERWGFEVKTIWVIRDWLPMIISSERRHPNYGDGYELALFEYGWIAQYMGELNPFTIVNSSVLFERPEMVLRHLEQFTELSLIAQGALEILEENHEWDWGLSTWDLVYANLAVPNFKKIFDGIRWSASLASYNMGSLIPGLIYSSNASTAVEIGVGNGFTSQVIARALRGNTDNGLLVSIDVNPGCEQLSLNGSVGIDVKHKFVLGDSWTLNLADYLEGRILDFALVDGDHSYEVAKNDMEKCGRLLKPKGFLLCHDYAPGHPGVVKAVKEFMATGQWDMIHLPEDGTRKTAVYSTAVLQKKGEGFRN